MAEDLAPAAPAVPAAADTPAAPDRERSARGSALRSPQDRPFRYRFGVAYLVLAVIAGAGVGSAYLLWEREPDETARWSAWQPTGRETSFPAQIAEHIGRRYRHPEGGQLVAVIASPPQVQTREGAVPLQWVALQAETAATAGSTSDEEDFDIVPVGERAVMYTMCGLGDRCAIAQGAPSVARARVLRRQSLELALYSFKYVEGVDSVIVLMPPNLGDPADDTDDTQTALFFQKSEFDRELDRPIQETLAGRVPQGLQISTIEQLTIDRLTQPRHFLAEFQPTQVGGWVIVLAPLPVINRP